MAANLQNATLSYTMWEQTQVRNFTGAFFRCVCKRGKITNFYEIL